MTAMHDLLYLVFVACAVFAVVMVAKLQDAPPGPDGDQDDDRVIVIPQLFFSARGRLGRGEYWIGATAVLASIALDSAVPSAGALMWLSALVTLVMFYSAICLYAKRLHDLGLSVWLQLFLYAAGLVIIVIGAVQIVPPAVRFAMEHPNDQAGFQAMVQSLTHRNVLIVYGYPALKVLFTIGLGLPPSRSDENIFGQTPESIGPEFA